MVVAGVPYLVMQLDRGLRWLLRGIAGVWIVIVLLVAAAMVGPIVEASQQQPQGQSVDDLRDGVSSLSSWVRMEGRIVTLSAPQSVEAGQQVQSLLVEPSGDAIVLISARPIDDLSEITGRVQNSANMDSTARSVGGPRFPEGNIEVIDRYNVAVDDPIVPPDQRDWTSVWIAVLAAGVLLVAHRVGYPVIRLRRDADPAAGRPLEVGEEMRVRLVDPADETGPRLTAPRGLLRRLPRTEPTDPYFEMRLDGGDRPILFRRHRWSRATPGTVTTLAETVPIVHLHDWGIEVVLALESQADRDRLLASFALDDDKASPSATGEPVSA
jgi:hypothetical protein